MKLLVVTPSTTLENEHEILEQMFKHGLKYLHVRKPKYSREKMISYLSGFSTRNRDKIIIHSHHSLALSMGLKGIHLTEKHREETFGVWKKFNLFRLRRSNLQITTSFHKLQDIDRERKKYRYVFFSPVFESITKEDYEPSYSLGVIYDKLQKTKTNVVALGGVDAAKIDLCFETGFWGVALSGYLWQSDDPLTNFNIVKELCSKYKTQS
jgi:thiamine-phosphate pyrophosphorylase